MSLIMLNWMWNHIGWEQNVQVIFHPKIKRKKKLCKLHYFWVNCCFKFYMMIRIAHAHMITIKTIAQLFNHENVPVPCTISKCPAGVSSDQHTVLQELCLSKCWWTSVLWFIVFVLFQWTLRLWSSLWPWCPVCCCWPLLCAAAAAAVNADAHPGDTIYTNRLNLPTLTRYRLNTHELT